MDESDVVSEREFMDACWKGANECVDSCRRFLESTVGKDSVYGIDHVAVWAGAAQCLTFWERHAGELGLVKHLNREFTKARESGATAIGLHDAVMAAALHYAQATQGLILQDAGSLTFPLTFPQRAAVADFDECLSFALGTNPEHVRSPRVTVAECARMWALEGQWAYGTITPRDVADILGDKAPDMDACAEIATCAVENIDTSWQIGDQVADQVHAEFETWRECNPPIDKTAPQDVAAAAKRAAAASVGDGGSAGGAKL